MASQYDKKAPINVAGAGGNVVVAAQPGLTIRVTHYLLVAAGAVDVTWESGGGSVLGGPLPFGANGGTMSPSESDGGLIDTLPGEALVLFLSQAIQVGGHLRYILL